MVLTIPDVHHMVTPSIQPEVWAEKCNLYALGFIQRHAAALPAERVLATIPPGLALESLEVFIHTVLPDQARGAAFRSHVRLVSGRSEPLDALSQVQAEDHAASRNRSTAWVTVHTPANPVSWQARRVHYTQLRRGLARAQHQQTQQLLQVTLSVFESG